MYAHLLLLYLKPWEIMDESFLAICQESIWLFKMIWSDIDHTCLDHCEMLSRSRIAGRLRALALKRNSPFLPDAPHATRTCDDTNAHPWSCIRQTEGVSCIESRWWSWWLVIVDWLFWLKRVRLLWKKKSFHEMCLPMWQAFLMQFSWISMK